MKGINKVNVNPADVMMGSNMAIILEPEPESKPVQSTSTKLTDKNITVNSVNYTVSTNVTSNVTAKPKQDTIKIHHKWKAKPHGKHFWPPSTSASTSKPKAESTKPRFIMVIHGLKKSKKHRKFCCKLCQNVADSQANANKHYKDTHLPVNCLECAMVFSNPSSLHRHKYMHLDKKFCCRNCNKYFPFESDLAGHRLKHRHHPGFQCNQSKMGVCVANGILPNRTWLNMYVCTVGKFIAVMNVIILLLIFVTFVHIDIHIQTNLNIHARTVKKCSSTIPKCEDMKKNVKINLIHKIL